jgi:lipid A 4'-phosphatase
MRQFEHRVDTRLIWASFFLALALFTMAPNLDLLVSARFYSAQSGFFHGDAPLTLALYKWTPHIGRALIVLLVMYALLARLLSRWFASRGKSDLALRSKGPWRHAAIVALCCMLLGPGLLIEGVLKNSMGRPRPIQIEQFGGDQVYLGAWTPGHDPEHHRSFVSSHAAAGFALLSLGVTCGPVWRRRWLFIGIATGSMVGMGRMLQGGHFLSDIVFAFYAVWVPCDLIARVHAWSAKLVPHSPWPSGQTLYQRLHNAKNDGVIMELGLHPAALRQAERGDVGPVRLGNDGLTTLQPDLNLGVHATTFMQSDHAP